MLLGVLSHHLYLGVLPHVLYCMGVLSRVVYQMGVQSPSAYYMRVLQNCTATTKYFIGCAT